jgi:Spy/CpxP family protein refolding chaperone
MKKSIAAAVLVHAALLVGIAQFAPSVRAEGGPREERMEKFNEKRVDHLAEKLSLTADQKTAVKKIFDEQKAKHESTMKETDDKIAALLTPDQKKEFEEMKAERKEKMKERREHRREKRDDK